MLKIDLQSWESDYKKTIRQTVICKREIILLEGVSLK